MKPIIVTTLAFLTLGISQPGFAQQQALKAGAAKVDITLADEDTFAETAIVNGILDLMQESK